MELLPLRPGSARLSLRTCPYGMYSSKSAKLSRLAGIGCCQAQKESVRSMAVTARSPDAGAPPIKAIHLPGVHGDFRSVLQARIDKLRATRSSEHHETARFFEYLLSQVDAGKYGLVQKHHLANPDGMTKYLDPVIWFESKLRVARKLGLDQRPPLRILDLGTGPGHFPVVARFYGHDVVGTDLPRVSGGVDGTGHFYDSLCSIYGVRRISHIIRPNELLQGLDGRYDLVTGFLAAFNVDRHRQPWDVITWRFFLADLKCNILTPGGMLFLMLDDKKLTVEVWNYLLSIADWSVQRSKQIFISHFSQL